MSVIHERALAHDDVVRSDSPEKMLFSRGLWVCSTGCGSERVEPPPSLARQLVASAQSAGLGTPSGPEHLAQGSRVRVVSTGRLRDDEAVKVLVQLGAEGGDARTDSRREPPPPGQRPDAAGVEGVRTHRTIDSAAHLTVGEVTLRCPYGSPFGLPPSARCRTVTSWPPLPRHTSVSAGKGQPRLLTSASMQRYPEGG